MKDFPVKYLILISCWLASCAVWAANSAEEIEPSENNPSITAKAKYTVPNKLLQRDGDVSHFLSTWSRQDERTVLMQGSEEIIGFYVPQRTRTPQGAVLILPNDGEHGQWPVVVAPLRDTLPDSGWSTLVVHLPNVPTPTTSRTLDFNEEVSKNKRSSYQKEMYARIGAAVNYLQAQGLLNIAVIAHGSSATWAALWLMDSGMGVDKERGLGFIMIDAVEDNTAPESLNASLTPIKFPVLDLITPFNRNALSTNLTRKGVMFSSKNQHYQQLELSNIGMQTANTNPITRRVRGWLKKEMAGEERKVKQPTEN